MTTLTDLASEIKLRKEKARFQRFTQAQINRPLYWAGCLECEYGFARTSVLEDVIADARRHAERARHHVDIRFDVVGVYHDTIRPEEVCS